MLHSICIGKIGRTLKKFYRKFNEKGFDSPFYSQRMSDGTLKLFAYYLLLHEKNPRQLVFIEEPEILKTIICYYT